MHIGEHSSVKTDTQPNIGIPILAVNYSLTPEQQRALIGVPESVLTTSRPPADEPYVYIDVPSVPDLPVIIQDRQIPIADVIERSNWQSFIHHQKLALRYLWLVLTTDVYDLWNDWRNR